MRSRNVVIFAGAVAAVFVLALLLRQPVTQHAVVDDNIIVQSDYRLSGTHEGDLVVMGDNIVLAEGSSVTGNVSLIGGTVLVAGQVKGNLTVLGENVTVAQDIINGNANLMGKSVKIDSSVEGKLVVNSEAVEISRVANFAGDINICAPKIADSRMETAPAIQCSGVDLAAFAPLMAIRSGIQPDSHQLPVIALILLTAFGGVLLTGMSVLSVTFFPRQISHIEEAMRARPRSFVGVGIATYALEIGVFFALLVLLAILPPLGLLLIPVFLILSLLLLLLSVSGLITLVVMLGDWLLRRVTRPPMPPLIAAVIGSLALSLGLAVVAALPYGFVISFFLLGALSSVGLGASLFTRIGTRPASRTYFIQG